MQDLGSTDPALVKKWTRFMGNVNNGRIEHTAWVDTELTKCMLNDMVEEARIKLFLHSWGTRAIVEDGRVKGVIFESKSGRQAVLGKIIIDGTGDGDLLPSAGAEFDGTAGSGYPQLNAGPGLPAGQLRLSETIAISAKPIPRNMKN